MATLRWSKVCQFRTQTIFLQKYIFSYEKNNVIVNYPIPVGPTSVSPAFITVSSRNRSYFFNLAQCGFYQEMVKNILTDLIDKIVVRAAKVYAVPCQAMQCQTGTEIRNLVPRAFSSTFFKMADRRQNLLPTIRNFEKPSRRGRGCWNPTMSSEEKTFDYLRKNFHICTKQIFWNRNLLLT